MIWAVVLVWFFFYCMWQVLCYLAIPAIYVIVFSLIIYLFIVLFSDLFKPIWDRLPHPTVVPEPPKIIEKRIDTSEETRFFAKEAIASTRILEEVSTPVERSSEGSIEIVINSKNNGEFRVSENVYRWLSMKPDRLGQYDTRFKRDWLRDDADLVRAVLALGDRAAERYTTLTVVSIPAGTNWIIRNENGKEFVQDTESGRKWY